MVASGGTNAPQVKRRRLTKEDRGEQLLDIAEQLIVAHGYEAISIEDVARAAGVTRPILYDHFGSKEGMLLACCRRARSQFETSLATVMRDAAGDVEALVERAGAVYFEMLERDPRRWAILFTSTTAQSGILADGLAALRRGTILRIAHLILQKAPEAPPHIVEACAYAISGVGEQLGRCMLVNPALNRVEALAIYRTFIASGLQGVLKT